MGEAKLLLAAEMRKSRQGMTLPRKVMMGTIYFVVPLLVGAALWEWTYRVAEDNVEKDVREFRR